MATDPRVEPPLGPAFPMGKRAGQQVGERRASGDIANTGPFRGPLPWKAPSLDLKLTVRPRPSSVGQVLWVTVPVVRIGERPKADGGDPRLVLEKGPSHAVHPIHDTVVGTENDGMARVDLLDQPEVFHDVANGRALREVEPVHRVDLLEFCQRDLLDGEICGHLDETVYVPSVHAPLAGPEVVLLAHPCSLPGEHGARVSLRHPRAHDAQVVNRHAEDNLNPATWSYDERTPSQVTG